MHDYNDTASYPDSVRATSINVKSCAYMSELGEAQCVHCHFHHLYASTGNVPPPSAWLHDF